MGWKLYVTKEIKLFDSTCSTYFISEINPSSVLKHSKNSESDCCIGPNFCLSYYNPHIGKIYMYLQIGPNPQRCKAKWKCSCVPLFYGRIKNLSNLDGIQGFKNYRNIRTWITYQRNKYLIITPFANGSGLFKLVLFCCSS